ncbi:hypothetical protein J6590_063051 [Homalodisca vitripennis]|nr:hypothetical protein J6590_063051 [Homalodisca vitripennis]
MRGSRPRPEPKPKADRPGRRPTNITPKSSRPITVMNVPERRSSLFRVIKAEMDPKWSHKVRTCHSAFGHGAAHEGHTPTWRLWPAYANYCNRFTADSCNPCSPLLSSGQSTPTPPSATSTVSHESKAAVRLGCLAAATNQPPVNIAISQRI